jgi:Ca-activated chloride channel family protein
LRAPGWLLLLPCVCVCGSPQAAAFSWEDLWTRPDQQGERALQAGHAAEAATLFQDPRRRAYAEIEAGQLEAAAKRLAPLQDPASEYNRGNALARQGQLQPALEAYDAALARMPADSSLARAARHNRDLVAAQQKKQPPQNGGGNRAGGSQPSQNQGDGQGQKAGQQGSQQNPGSSNQSGQNSSGMNQGAQQNSASGQSGMGQASAGPGSGGTSGDRDEAQQSAAAAAHRAGGPGDAAHSSGSNDVGSNAAPSSTPRERPPSGPPPSEQAIARDQWLRQIPDDPGGLLRRKFLIEHLIRERQLERGGGP